MTACIRHISQNGFLVDHRNRIVLADDLDGVGGAQLKDRVCVVRVRNAQGVHAVVFGHNHRRSRAAPLFRIQRQPADLVRLAAPIVDREDLAVPVTDDMRVLAAVRNDYRATGGVSLDLFHRHAGQSHVQIFAVLNRAGAVIDADLQIPLGIGGIRLARIDFGVGAGALLFLDLDLCGLREIVGHIRALAVSFEVDPAAGRQVEGRLLSVKHLTVNQDLIAAVFLEHPIFHRCLDGGLGSAVNVGAHLHNAVLHQEVALVRPGFLIQVGPAVGIGNRCNFAVVGAAGCSSIRELLIAVPIF